jgi:hypothetical protein
MGAYVATTPGDVKCEARHSGAKRHPDLHRLGSTYNSTHGSWPIVDRNRDQIVHALLSLPMVKNGT